MNRGDADVFYPDELLFVGFAYSARGQVAVSFSTPYLLSSLLDCVGWDGKGKGLIRTPPPGWFQRKTHHCAHQFGGSYWGPGTCIVEDAFLCIEKA